MRIQTFKNMTGLIHGAGPKRIWCDKDGILKIGTTEIVVSAGKDEVMPLLFNGCDGDYHATFAASNGEGYDLGTVAVRGGRIASPPAMAVEVAELRCRLDEAETEMEDMRVKIQELFQMFDTNSLNFLIK